MDDYLTVDDIVVTFQKGRRAFTAVDGVSFSMRRGETLALVGESGSGKTTIGRAIMGLVPLRSGRIALNGRDISGTRRRERRARARELQVVFQDPYGSLNPAMLVGRTLSEPVRVQRRMRVGEARSLVDGLLAEVALPGDASDRYPASFSGGQRQRIAIARALAIDPDFVVCDEPTSALDVSTQARVLALLRREQERRSLSYLFITHDLAVVRNFADRVIVLRHGEIVETGPVAQVCDDPRHPYTQALVAAAPVPDPLVQAERRAARLAKRRTP